MDTTAFEQLVVEVLEELPDDFRRHLTNVAVVVQRRPTSEQRRGLGIKPWQTIYGLYEGVSLPERVTSDWPLEPDQITIFQEPLERDFPRSELRAQVRRTVLHEIAHYFGISDERLHELDAY